MNGKRMHHCLKCRGNTPHIELGLGEDDTMEVMWLRCQFCGNLTNEGTGQLAPDPSDGIKPMNLWQVEYELQPPTPQATP